MKKEILFIVSLLALLSACQTAPTPVPTSAPPAPNTVSPAAAPTSYPAPPVQPATAYPAQPVATASTRADVQPSAPSTPSFSLPPWLAQAVGEARQDLARRTGQTVDSIVLLAIEGDEFPAGDLGCPGTGPARPIPALVTGSRIWLEAAGVRYRYHAHGSDVVYCGPE